MERVDRGRLNAMLDQRVRDGVMRRAIGKWLQAGVVEAGRHWHPERGTPQGGVISPLLANIYLHEVLDKWFEDTVKPRLRGRAFMVRYADDAVLCFGHESDARRVMAALGQRLARYGLSLNEAKTRLVRFTGRGPADDEPMTFDFLGFTHLWGRSRKGRPVVQRKTAKARFARALRRMVHWCRDHRHQRVADQQRALNRRLRGHYAYYVVTGNARALWRFVHAVERAWRKWLSRRSAASRLAWDPFEALLKRYPLAPPRVVHSVYRA